MWHGVDPLAEMFPSFSAFNYVMNNPIRFIDPTGMNPEEGGGDNGGGEEKPINGGVLNGPTITAPAPVRGSGKNAPYNYVTSMVNRNLDPGKVTTTYNPDQAKAHFNSFFYNESYLPNRLIAHYIHGNGSQYDMNLDEYNELAVTKPNILLSKEYANAPFDVPINGKFIIPEVFAYQAGTLGQTSMIYEGTLIKYSKGGYSFSGTMHIEDVYNFDHKKDRPLGNAILTFWGRISMMGKGYLIKTPKISISEVNGQNKFWPRWKGNPKGGKSEEGGGKWR